jgi:hypothetical protein
MTDFHIPFFIYDIRNKQLITSKRIPSDIQDNKSIVFSETPIAGLNYDPLSFGGMGNRKISFSIDLVKKNNNVGNVLMVKQFENLRNQPFGFKNLFRKSGQFVGGNKVLYHWGTSNFIPVVWYVTKCNFNHKSAFTNRFGYTQYSTIDIELLLDETNPIFRVEDMFRKLSGFVQQGFSSADLVDTVS